MKRKKLTPLPKLVKKLDDIFQTVIRYRDNFVCITCGRKFPSGERKQCHAGHFITRGVYATRWDEENVNCQCAACNLKQSLADVEIIHRYQSALQAKYGNDVIERLFQKRHTPFKLSRTFLENEIEIYSNALKHYEGQL